MTPSPDTPPGLARRILASPPARVLLLGFILLLMMGLNEDVMTSYAGQPVKAVQHVIALAIAGLAVYIAHAHFIERRAVPELSLPGMGREFGMGLLIGAGLYAACEMVLMALGIYRIDGLNPLSYLVPAIAMAISSSVFEELLFRGVLFLAVEKWFGSWAALVVSSLVFGLTHLVNPQSTIEGAVHCCRGRHPAGSGFHADAPAVVEHRLSHGLELHTVGHLLGHRLRQRCRTGLDPIHRQRPRPADRGEFRCRVVRAGTGAVHLDRDRDAGHGGQAREDHAPDLEALSLQAMELIRP